MFAGSIVFLAVCIAFFYLLSFTNELRAFDKQRAAQLRDVARQFGFDYLQKSDTGMWLIGRLRHFSLFNAGYQLPGMQPPEESLNFMTGHLEDTFAVLCDYRTAVRGGEGITDTAVILLHSANARLPHFQLHPRAILRQEGIPFPAHPIFSHRFAVQGTDEAAIRALFDYESITRCEQLSHIHIEAKGEWLLAYLPGQPLPPDILYIYLYEVHQLFRALIRADEQQPAPEFSELAVWRPLTYKPQSENDSFIRLSPPQ